MKRIDLWAAYYDSDYLDGVGGPCMGFRLCSKKDRRDLEELGLLNLEELGLLNRGEILILNYLEAVINERLRGKNK